MNLSTLQEELSSCQCKTTLYGEKKKTKKCALRIPYCSRICENIRARTLVVSRAWIRKDVVRNTYVQTEWKMGSIHFCGDDKIVEVVLRTIISVNQLSIYGAVADMCDELACRISDCSEPGKIGRLMSRVYCLFLEATHYPK